MALAAHVAPTAPAALGAPIALAALGAPIASAALVAPIASAAPVENNGFPIHTPLHYHSIFLMYKL